ncbi:MAG: Rid family detoxifying hydrolase [Candidatus Krumholzibacteriia bacterium]
MTRKIIHTDRAPQAIGPYSQGTACCGLVFTSMQIALHPGKGELVGQDHAEQAHRCLMNVQAILEQGGSSLAGALKVTVYLTDLSAFAAVNEVYEAFFPVEPPARAVVEVAALPKGALVAIEAVAASH